MQIELLPDTDLFTVEADAYAHGCNCMALMGAGVALQMRTRYNLMYQEYQRMCKNWGYDKSLAGNVMYWKSSMPKIFNLFTQHQPGRHAKLEYIQSSFRGMFNFAIEDKLTSIAIPQIGAGIGGLKWDDVFETIVQVGDVVNWDGTLYIAIR